MARPQRLASSLLLTRAQGQCRWQHTVSLTSRDPLHNSHWLWPVAAAAAAALAGTAAAAAQEQQQESAGALRLQQWLEDHGADMRALRLAPSSDPAVGAALYATPEAPRRQPAPWLGRRLGSWLLPRSFQSAPLATFPLNLALTAEAACRDPQLGQDYMNLMEQGLAGEREVAMLLLLVERLRGTSSRWAAWVQQLPTRHNTPLVYSEEQLQQLRGTQLAAAAAALKRSTTNQWSQLAPAATAMLKKLGVEKAPTYEDWQWAVATFWSRAQSLPLMSSHPAAGGGAGGASSSSLSLQVLEGVVPGLDFANHSMTPTCWWEVEAGPRGKEEPHVVLRADRAHWPAPGQEVTISYGDKGNEELLLLYGFATPDNPHDTLMVPCPLPPPDQWNPDTPLRLQLLMAQGLRPQLFLSRAHLATLDQQLEQQHNKATSKRSQQQQGSNSSSSSLPEQAQQVLQVFVLEAKQLPQRLQQLQQQQADGSPAPGSALRSRSGSASASSSQLEEASSQVERLGMHMALITTFVRLLELQLHRLEGPEGTGPLQQDEALLAQLLEAAQPTTSTSSRQQAATPGQHAAQGQQQQLPAAAGRAAGESWLRSCVAYRVGQKQLVRGYLVHATAELNATMAALSEAVAEEARLQQKAG